MLAARQLDQAKLPDLGMRGRAVTFPVSKLLTSIRGPRIAPASPKPVPFPLAECRPQRRVRNNAHSG